MIYKSGNPCNTVYISGACNSNPYAADWGENDRICVAVNEAVAILKPDLGRGIPGKIERTFLGHKGRVNAVKWVRNLNNNETDSFVSASVDGSVIIWVVDENGDYTPKFVLSEHSESVTDVSAVSLQWKDINYILVASLSRDTLKFWKKSDHDEEFSCSVTINCPDTGVGVGGLSFAFLPNTTNLIFASCKNFVDVCLYTSCDNDLSNFRENSLLKGHTNWVNDLAFATCDSGSTLLLASASHDCTIRVWRISRRQKAREELDLSELIIMTNEGEFSVALYSILHGHDQWVYTVHWKYFKTEDELKLLSVSADKTAILWQRDLDLNTWVESYRLGDVGGNVAGFLGGCFDPSGEFLMTHDLVGAFHVWRYDKHCDSWSPATLPSGHNDVVNDIQWDPQGQFLVSVGADKTTRIHAPLKIDQSYWFEFARPQTHGHIVWCVAVLKQNRFVSGASEKELRSFIAAKNFIQTFKKVSFLEEVDESKYPHNNAILPSLDLSNKAADEVENVNINSTLSANIVDENRVVPTEEELARNTLWPEIQKLYYHPNEMSCVAANFDGTLIASACKANSAKEAAIAIWFVEWDLIKRVQTIPFHQLTVTQLSFSPDGVYLLSVSRDRTWNLFRKKTAENSFESIAFTTKNNAIHKRQLNACSWTHDSKYFVTGSRDGNVVIWSQQGENLEKDDKTATDDASLNGVSSQYALKVDENVCSLAFAPQFVKTCEYILAVGFGSGKIGLYVWNSVECRHWLTLDKDIAHHQEVTRITFRPISDNQGCLNKLSTLQLASAGADRLVKIYELDTSNL